MDYGQKSEVATTPLEVWLREERQPFSGWDFTYLDGRISGGQEHWSYPDRAAELMRRSTSVIDLDTGGGENLLSLRDHWPARVVATEDYLPNFELATESLSAAGAKVLKVAVSETEPMPFEDGEFNLVLCRHAAFNSSEVARVLSPSGTFLTQQNHGMWLWDLQAAFDSAPQLPDVTAARYVPLLEDTGLQIVDMQEWEGHVSFSDVGAIVYYLKAIPWEVPDFTVKTHLRYLYELQERVNAGEELEFFAGKFLIEARKR